MVSGEIDWNICPLVLGMTKGSIVLGRWHRAIEPLVIPRTAGQIFQSTQHYTENKRLREHGGELMCSGRVSSSCSTSDTCRATIITKPVICHKKSLKIPKG